MICHAVAFYYLAAPGQPNSASFTYGFISCWLAFRAYSAGVDTHRAWKARRNGNRSDHSTCAVWPVGAAAALVVFSRKEIAAVLSAPKGDRGGRDGLAGMNEQFIANMRLFVETNAKLEAVAAVLVEILDVNRDIHTELVRRK